MTKCYLNIDNVWWKWFWKLYVKTLWWGRIQQYDGTNNFVDLFQFVVISLENVPIWEAISIFWDAIIVYVTISINCFSKWHLNWADPADLSDNDTGQCKPETFI